MVRNWSPASFTHVIAVNFSMQRACRPIGQFVLADQPLKDAHAVA